MCFSSPECKLEKFTKTGLEQFLEFLDPSGRGQEGAGGENPGLPPLKSTQLREGCAKVKE